VRREKASSQEEEEEEEEEEATTTTTTTTLVFPRDISESVVAAAAAAAAPGGRGEDGRTRDQDQARPLDGMKSSLSLARSSRRECAPLRLDSPLPPPPAFTSCVQSNSNGLFRWSHHPPPPLPPSLANDSLCPLWQWWRHRHCHHCRRPRRLLNRKIRGNAASEEEA